MPCSVGGSLTGDPWEVVDHTYVAEPACCRPTSLEHLESASWPMNLEPETKALLWQLVEAARRVPDRNGATSWHFVPMEAMSFNTQGCQGAGSVTMTKVIFVT